MLKKEAFLDFSSVQKHNNTCHNQRVAVETHRPFLNLDIDNSAPLR
jgi:hypothetical protein